jgi:hypothetical protein
MTRARGGFCRLAQAGGNGFRQCPNDVLGRHHPPAVHRHHGEQRLGVERAVVAAGVLKAARPSRVVGGCPTSASTETRKCAARRDVRYWHRPHRRCNRHRLPRGTRRCSRPPGTAEPFDHLTSQTVTRPVSNFGSGCVLIHRLRCNSTSPGPAKTISMATIWSITIDTLPAGVAVTPVSATRVTS